MHYLIHNTVKEDFAVAQLRPQTDHAISSPCSDDRTNYLKVQKENYLKHLAIAALDNLLRRQMAGMCTGGEYGNRTHTHKRS